MHAYSLKGVHSNKRFPKAVKERFDAVYPNTIITAFGLLTVCMTCMLSHSAQQMPLQTVNNTTIELVRMKVVNTFQRI